MKITPKKNNISPESREAIKQFREKQILSNIKYHKIFIGLLILINIGLICFMIFYSRKIKQLQNLSKQHSSLINTKDSAQSSVKNDIFKKFLNLFAFCPPNIFGLTYLFDNGEEFLKVRDTVYNYVESLGDIPHEKDSRSTIFIYQNLIDTEKYEEFLNRITYFENIFIVIKTDEEKKFGIFIKEPIIPDDEDNSKDYIGNTTHIFLYSFEKQKMYKFIGTRDKSFKMTKTELINLGDNEIIFKADFSTNGCELNSPLKSFNLEGDDEMVFIGKTGKFNTVEMEIFSFSQY